MGLEREPWRKIDNEAKIGKIVRAISQDVGKRFKEEKLRKIFPKKMIYDKKLGKEVDIGLISCEWVYDLLNFYEPIYNKLMEYLGIIIKHYEAGLNINNNREFRIRFFVDVVPTYKEKIKDFSQIAKLGLMDDLNRGMLSKRVKEGDDIQW